MNACGLSKLLPLLAALCCAACGRSSSPRSHDDARVKRALETYAQIAEASYEDATEAARALARSVESLVAQPSAATLQAARQAWLAARVPYAQTEVFRFYDGPIDALELLINTWPIDESYVEAGDAGAGLQGIIEDSAHYPEITRELLVQLNGRGGETSIATGYHVIEFLLWGRDERRDGPGDRPYSDYLTQSGPLAARRARYLTVSVELLVEHLERVTAAWRDTTDSYRAQLLREPSHVALAKVWKGLGSLSGAELAGERLTVAYETKNQENEHSCFSDSTHLDLANDARGLLNVCTGLYRRRDGREISGPGMCELAGAYDAALGRALARQMAASLADLEAIPAPFDTAILGKDDAPARRAVAQAIAALQLQTQTLAKSAAAMQLMAANVDAREARR